MRNIKIFLALNLNVVSYKVILSGLPYIKRVDSESIVHYHYCTYVPIL